MADNLGTDLLKKNVSEAVNTWCLAEYRCYTCSSLGRHTTVHASGFPGITLTTNCELLDNEVLDWTSHHEA